MCSLNYLAEQLQFPDLKQRTEMGSERVGLPLWQQDTHTPDYPQSKANDIYSFRLRLLILLTRGFGGKIPLQYICK